MLLIIPASEDRLSDSLFGADVFVDCHITAGSGYFVTVTKCPDPIVTRDLLKQEEESKQELKDLFEKLGYSL